MILTTSAQGNINKGFGDTHTFWFAVNDSGSGAAGTSPVVTVHRSDNDDTLAPIYSLIPVRMVHANAPAGAYLARIAATAANGFVQGDDYGVFVTITVGGRTPTGFLGPLYT